MYSSNEQARHEHNGVVKWIDGVLAGLLEDNYTAQAQEGLGIPTDDLMDVPEGHPWMASDGLTASLDD